MSDTPPPPPSGPGTPQPNPSAYSTPPAAPQAPYGAAPQYGAAPYGAAPPLGYAQAAKTNTLAIVSLISSIVGVTVVPFIGSIVGVITGHMSLSQLKTNGEQGRGMALAGTIIGWVGIALSIVGVIAFIAFFSFIAATYPEWRTR